MYGYNPHPSSVAREIRMFLVLLVVEYSRSGFYFTVILHFEDKPGHKNKAQWEVEVEPTLKGEETEFHIFFSFSDWLLISLLVIDAYVLYYFVSKFRKKRS